VAKVFLDVEFKQVRVMLTISQVVEWLSEDHQLALEFLFHHHFLIIGDSINAKTLLHFLLLHQEFFVLFTERFTESWDSLFAVALFKFIEGIS